MQFPPSFLDEIRHRLPVSQLVGKRVRLTRAGREFKGLCPFHTEKSPSFYVNDDKGFYHCFGCAAHGDVITFAVKYENLGFGEAVKMLAAEAGLALPEISPQQAARAAKQQSEQQRGLALYEAACVFFQQHAPHIDDFWQRRGLAPEQRAQFRLGYAPADSHALLNALRSAGYKDEEIIQYGLARKSDRDGSVYGFFRDRALFPIRDRQNRVVGFGARAIRAGDEPKYLNSPDHPLFTKGQLLYNFAGARQLLRGGKPLLVVEGYMDVIAADSAGWPAVGPLGTALTVAQLEMLWRMLGAGGTPPVLCFDGDNAGRNAAYRALDRALPLITAQRTLRFAFLPQGEDPDSLLRKGGTGEFEKLIGTAENVADVLWQRATENQDFTAAESRAALHQRLRGETKLITDKDLQKYLQDDLAARLAEAFPAPQRPPMFQKFGKDGRGQNFTPLGPKPKNTVDTIDIGLICLVSLINHSTLLHEYHEELAHINLPQINDQNWLKELLNLPHDPPPDQHPLFEQIRESLQPRLTPAFYRMAPHTKPDVDYALIVRPAFAHWLKRLAKEL